MTKIGLYAIGKSTTLESNKNHRDNGFDHGVCHSLLLLYDAKTSHGKNVNYFNCLGYDHSITSISLF